MASPSQRLIEFAVLALLVAMSLAASGFFSGCSAKIEPGAFADAIVIDVTLCVSSNDVEVAVAD